MPTLQALADAFRVNETVMDVKLGGNKFGDEGLKARAPRRGATAGLKTYAYHHVNDVVSVGFLQHVVVCVHFTWVLGAGPSENLSGPGLGHGGQQNHRRGLVRFWRVGGARWPVQ